MTASLAPERSSVKMSSNYTKGAARFGTRWRTQRWVAPNTQRAYLLTLSTATSSERVRLPDPSGSPVARSAPARSPGMGTGLMGT